MQAALLVLQNIAHHAYVEEFKILAFELIIIENNSTETVYIKSYFLFLLFSHFHTKLILCLYEAMQMHFVSAAVSAKCGVKGNNE